MKFEWHAPKASANLRKHGVSFDEAMTVFADWESVTIPDSDHSEGEERFLIVGSSSRGHVLVVSHAERGENVRIISARRADPGERRRYMAGKTKSTDEIRDHYDFTGGVRGKYAARYAEGANVVVLAPDVAEIFPDTIAVNEALRTLARMSGKTLRSKAVPKKRRT